MRTAAACPSNFALERLLLAELPPEAAEVAAHVEGCPICRAKIEAKKADGDEFMRSAGADALRRALTARSPRDAGVASSEPPHVVVRSPIRRRSAFALLAVAAAIAVSFAVSHRRTPPAERTSAAAATEDEASVLRVQREWMEAIRDKDATALDRILADDYTYTDSRGRVSNKADSLRQARSVGGRMTSFQTSDEKAHIFGDTAVVTGRLRVEGVSGGEPYDAEVRFTDILARIEGEWRAVAAHASKP